MILASALDTLKNNVNAVGGAAQLSNKSLPDLVGGYIQAGLGILGIVLVVLIIYAGFLWMTAQGEEQKVTDAKAIIKNAIIGLIIMLAAYSITSYVTGTLLQG